MNETFEQMVLNIPELIGVLRKIRACESEVAAQLVLETYVRRLRAEWEKGAEPFAWAYSEDQGKAKPFVTTNPPASFAPNELSESEVVITPLYTRANLPPAEQEETAWLIEHPEARWGCGFYWCGDKYPTWGTIENAVRFSRKEDAEKVINSVDGMLGAEACEHQWLYTRPTLQPAEQEELERLREEVATCDCTGMHRHMHGVCMTCWKPIIDWADVVRAMKRDAEIGELSQLRAELAVLQKDKDIAELNAQHYYEELSALRQKVVPEETAWLIEQPDARWGTGYFWCGDKYPTWGTIDRAVRFSRKEDAEKVINAVDGMLGAEACEHQWSAAAQGKGEQP